MKSYFHCTASPSHSLPWRAVERLRLFDKEIIVIGFRRYSDIKEWVLYTYNISMIFVFIEPSYVVCKIAAVNTINCAVRCTLSATGNALDKALWLPHTLCSGQLSQYTFTTNTNGLCKSRTHGNRIDKSQWQLSPNRYTLYPHSKSES